MVLKEKNHNLLGAISRKIETSLYFMMMMLMNSLNNSSGTYEQHTNVGRYVTAYILHMRAACIDRVTD